MAAASKLKYRPLPGTPYPFYSPRMALYRCRVILPTCPASNQKQMPPEKQSRQNAVEQGEVRLARVAGPANPRRWSRPDGGEAGQVENLFRPGHRRNSAPLALMNLVLHGLEPSIPFGDTIYEAPSGQRLDRILANPPFGMRGVNQASDRDDSPSPPATSSSISCSMYLRSSNPVAGPPWCCRTTAFSPIQRARSSRFSPRINGRPRARAPSLALLCAAKRLGRFAHPEYGAARKEFAESFPYVPGPGIATWLATNSGATA